LTESILGDRQLRFTLLPMTKLKPLSSILIGSLSMALWSCADPEPTTKPSYSSLRESVYASVVVEPDGRYQVFPAVPGILDEVLVEAGDTVKAGDVLAVLRKQSAELQAENARLATELAQARVDGQGAQLQSIADEISLLEQQLSLDSTNLARQERLSQKGIGTAVELENMRLKSSTTRNMLGLKRQQYDRFKTEADKQLAQQRNLQSSAGLALDDHLIRSQLDGIVYRVEREAGEMVSSQQPFGIVGSAEEFEIDMMVDESDIAAVRIGMAVIISLDAYAGRTFSAKVTRIHPQKDERTQTFQVSACFDSPPEALYSGLSGEANIIISEREGVMHIPLDLLVNDSTVNTEDGARSIETGIRTMERVEILSGIDTSTVLIAP